MTSLRWRVIVDNDFAGDPDGLVSLAHVLLTDDVRVDLITSTPVDPVLAHLAGVDAGAGVVLEAELPVSVLDVDAESLSLAGFAALASPSDDPPDFFG